MAELDAQAQTTSAAPGGAAPAGAVVDDDPLAHLKKMSATAGLTSGTEYAAINTFSVAAVILAAASVLALLSDYWLIVPLGAVICAIIALRQIRSSNGTQTGIPLALAALALALALGGTVAAKDVIRMQRMREAQREVDAVIRKLGDAISTRDYATAYDLFGPRFHEQVTPTRFAEAWAGVTLKSAESNQNLIALDDAPADAPAVITLAVMHFDKGDLRERLTLQRVQGRWVIEEMPDVFPQEQTKKKRA